MMRVLFAVFAVALCLTVPAAGSEEDAVVAIFVFGRTGGWMASGFAVGDGSYVVTSADAVSEAIFGKKAQIAHAIVVSRWTGDAYPATLKLADDETKVALLKMPKPAVPGAAIASDSVLARARKATLGEVLSGEEVGDKFPTTIYALDVERSPKKYVVKMWRSANACLTEVRGHNWLFLSRVNPSEKAPKAALVLKPGVGALGTFHGRLVVEGGPGPVTFYRVLPCTELRALLRKAGVAETTLSTPSALPKGPADAAAAFQAMCRALSSSLFGRPPEAAENASAALKLRPDSAIANMLLGTALAGQGKLDDALKAMDKALELDPSLPDGRLTRGLALAAAGKSAEAEKDLRKAIEDQPRDARPVLALAGLLAAKDQTLQDAIKLAKGAVQRWPDDLDARITLARLLKRNKDFDAAAAELRSVLQTVPKWGDARVALASTYEAAGQLDKAEAEYRTLLQNEPENLDAHLALIDFLISAGRKEDARQAIEAARKLKLEPQALEAVKKLEDRLETVKKD